MQLFKSLTSYIFPSVFAQDGSSIIGPIDNKVLPPIFSKIDSGLVVLITNVLRLFFVVAGVVALFNFVLAGFAYMTSGGDAKKLTEAGNKIWYSLIGLILIVGSFALSGFFGYIIFGRWDAFTNIIIYSPNQ